MFKKLSSIVAASLCAAMLACSTQTLAATAQTIFVSVDAVLAITNPGYDETQLIAASDAAVTALQEWKPGTSGTEAIQALTDFENVVKAIPAIPAKYQDVIGVAVSGIEGIIADVQAGQSLSSSTVAVATPKAYQASFNAALASHPELGNAKF